MSSAFNGSPVTPNRTFDQSQDKTTPNFRKLNHRGMSSADALAGTHGAHAELTHGDHWQQIEGAVTANILKDLTTTITRNEIRNVIEDEIRNIGGILNQTVTGSAIYTHIDTVDLNYLQVVTEAYASLKQITQPTAVISYIRSHSQAGWFSGTWVLENWQASADNVQLCINNWQVASDLNFNIAPYNFDASGANIAPQGFQQWVGNLGSGISGTTVGVGGPIIWVTAMVITEGNSAGRNSVV